MDSRILSCPNRTNKKGKKGDPLCANGVIVVWFCFFWFVVAVHTNENYLGCDSNTT